MQNIKTLPSLKYMHLAECSLNFKVLINKL